MYQNYQKPLNYLKRCWALIDLDALSFNLSRIKSKLPSATRIMAVVKADAYGHGDKAVAASLLENGVDFFAVSNIEEAITLRDGDLEGNPLRTLAGDIPQILILGYTPEEQVKALADYDICQTVFSLEYAHALNKACEAQGVRLNIHIKIDTGMNRLGIPQGEDKTAEAAVSEIAALPFLTVSGVFSHLSSADSIEKSDAEYTKMQADRFNALRSRLCEAGIDIPLWHLQNSAGIAFLENDIPYSYARAGIVLYGLQPGDAPLPFELKPVMSIKTVISHIKELEAGEAVSYSRKYITKDKTVVATLPIGYADGYFRALSGKAEVIINGKRAPIIGNICMDQLMVDVTGIEGLSRGDEVTVVGAEGNENITFVELAQKAGTIPYELMCAVCKRVPRVYVKNGEEVAVKNKVMYEI